MTTDNDKVLQGGTRRSAIFVAPEKLNLLERFFIWQHEGKFQCSRCKRWCKHYDSIPDECPCGDY